MKIKRRTALAALYAEWQAIIARRIRCNASGQDGSDFHLWLRSKGVDQPVQLELF